MYMYACAYSSTHKHVCMYTSRHIRGHAYAHVHAQAHVCISTCIHRCTCTCIHMHGHTRCKNNRSSDPPHFVGPFTGFPQSETQPCLLVPISALKIQPGKVGLEPAHSDTKKAAHLNRKCGPIVWNQNPAPKRVHGTHRVAINRRVPPRVPKT